MFPLACLFFFPISLYFLLFFSLHFFQVFFAFLSFENHVFHDFYFLFSSSLFCFYGSIFFMSGNVGSTCLQWCPFLVLVVLFRMRAKFFLLDLNFYSFYICNLVYIGNFFVPFVLVIGFTIGFFCSNLSKILFQGPWC
jgi:hypothetical protein